MDFANTTAFSADLLSAAPAGPYQLGCVIARPTFRIEGRELIPTPDEPWPIDSAPYTTPLGACPGDKPLLSGGVDVMVAGHARAPAGSAAACHAERRPAGQKCRGGDF